MKPTNRVRQHRSAARTAPQAKTSRNSKLENVHIAINDATGKPFADFEIPSTFYDAMQRDAKAKGISLKQWMANAITAKIQNHKSIGIPTASAEATAVRLPAFLDSYRLVDSCQGEDLWYGRERNIWIVPYPYLGQGEREITYAEAVKWINEKLHFNSGERYLARKGIFSGNPQTLELEHKWSIEARERQRPSLWNWIIAGG